MKKFLLLFLVLCSALAKAQDPLMLQGYSVFKEINESIKQQQISVRLLKIIDSDNDIFKQEMQYSLIPDYRKACSVFIFINECYKTRLHQQFNEIDKAIRSGQKADSMFVLIKDKVPVIFALGEEVVKLYPNNIYEPYSGSLVASTTCLLMKHNNKDAVKKVNTILSISDLDRMTHAFGFNTGLYIAVDSMGETKLRATLMDISRGYKILYSSYDSTKLLPYFKDFDTYISIAQKKYPSFAKDTDLQQRLSELYALYGLKRERE